MSYHPDKTTNFNEYLHRTSIITSLLIIFAVIIATLIITPPVSASDLDGFETAATTDDSQQDAANSQQNSDDSQQNSDDDGQKQQDQGNNPLDQLFIEIFRDICHELIRGMIYLTYEGAEMSWARVGGSTDIDPSLIQIRRTGEPTLPFFQVDCKYFRINSKIYAFDDGFEVGNGPFGLECRNTNFIEINPRDNLNLTQYHLLLRMSASRSQEFGIGIGWLNMSGNEQNSGFSVTFPVKIYLNPYLGLKLKPTYSWIHGNFINDTDLSIALTERFATLELGYRFLEANGVNLNGSYIGFALHY